ncbi:MAG TPA: thioredoxin domain-containing protein [Pyrinomonadaceae bacterium]
MNRLLFTLFIALVCAAPAAAQTQATQQQPPPPKPATVETLNAAEAAMLCGCEGAPLPAVLAVVNGVKITPADLGPETAERVRQLQTEVIKARERELDLQINSLLLDAEAKKRGVNTSKVIEDEIVSKATEPTDAEAQAFYDQNKERIQTGFADVKPQIVSYLREQRQRDLAAKLADRLRATAAVKTNVAKATPPASPADRARVFATVNGRNITSGDIEDSLRPLVFSVQEQVYNLRKRDLDVKINDMLLEAEALKRKVTTGALLEAEVKPAVVTDAEAQKFYDENKERINGDFAQVKPQIVEYLQQQARQKAESDFAKRLRAAATVQTFLTEPVPPTYDIATDDQPAKGAATAPVTLVEFTDYQCPSCAQQFPVIERIIAEMGDRVRVVVRDYPLTMHANAFKAAEAAEAAREQGKYWEYTALLFRNQSALEVGNLKQYATSLGLDRARFDAALDSGKFSDKVRRDILDGDKVGVTGTPSLFVNGRRVNDRTYEGLKAAIEAALKKK